MTRFIPQEVRLKDQRLAWVRPALSRDASAAYDIERDIVETGLGVVRTLNTFPPRESFIRDFKLSLTRGFFGDQGASLVVQLEEDGPVMGTATLKRLGPELVQHVALISVGVAPPWQGLGLGRHLMNALIHWATHGPGKGGVLRLELYVMASNHRAIALYQSLGFIEEGRRRAFHRAPDGTLSDDLVMGLLLPNSQH